MKKILLCILLFSTFVCAWQLTYLPSGAEASMFCDLLDLPSDSLLFASNITWPSGYSCALVCASEVGETLWSRSYSPAWGVNIVGLKGLLSGEFLTIGTIVPDAWGYNKADFFNMRLSATYDSLWLVRYGSQLDEELFDVEHIGEESLFLLGTAVEIAPPFASYGYLACVSSDGDTIWERLFGNNVILTTDAFISHDSLSIYCLYRDINEDTLALKITEFSLDGDSIGHARITYNYPSPMVSSYWATGIDREVGWLVVGNLNYSSFIAKYNRDSDSVSFEEGVSIYSYQSIDQLDDSVFVVAGSMGARPNRDMVLTWLDYHGDTIRSKVFDIDGDQFARSVHVLSNKNIVICGYTNPPAGSPRALAIMVDSLGNDIPGTAVEETPELPTTFSLSAHPNPFNSAVKISLDGVGAGFTPTIVEIFDLSGRRVERIPPAPLNKGGVEPRETGGSYIWTPDETVTSSIYLVRARADGAAAVKRVVYLK